MLGCLSTNPRITLFFLFSIMHSFSFLFRWSERMIRVQVLSSCIKTSFRMILTRRGEESLCLRHHCNRMGFCIWCEYDLSSWFTSLLLSWLPIIGLCDVDPKKSVFHSPFILFFDLFLPSSPSVIWDFRVKKYGIKISDARKYNRSCSPDPSSHVSHT